MRGPGYREAIDWIAGNDDRYWLRDRDAHEPILSVTAAMVCDLHDVSGERLIADLRRSLKKRYLNHEAWGKRPRVRTQLWNIEGLRRGPASQSRLCRGHELVGSGLGQTSGKVDCLWTNWRQITAG
jgi:hypothetical protein